MNIPTPVEMAVGDLASTAKGSAARANGGKPDLSLIPLEMLAQTMRHDPAAADAMEALGKFQTTHDPDHLWAALRSLGTPWFDCAKVFEYGRRKYAAWNWAKGMAWSIPLACAARHLMKMDEGVKFDEESGESHAGHVACNIVMLLQFIETYPEGNDLPPAGLLGS